MAARLSLWRQLLNTLQVRNDYDIPPWGLTWRSNTFFILSTIGAAVFTDLFLYSLVVPILPFMLEDRVGIPKDQIQSNVDSLLALYAGTSFLVSPIIGVLADRMKTRQAPLLLSLIALLGATALLFAGRSIAVLNLARVLQGLSAASVWTVGMAMCVETVGPDNLGKTMGIMFSVITVGPLFAPIIGGLLYKHAGYRGVAITAVSVIVIDLIMRTLVIEKKVALRYVSQTSSTGSDGTETLDDSEEDQDNEPAPQDGGEEQPLLGSKDQDLSAFVLSKDQPRLAKLIPILPCLANPRLLTSLFAVLVQALLIGSFDATIPTVSHELFNFDSLKAGSLFIPLGISDFILGPLFGWLLDYYGTKIVAVCGYVYIVPILVLLRLPQAGGNDQIILYSSILVLCGIGLAAIGGPSMLEATLVVGHYHDANPDFFGENGPYAQLYAFSNMVYCAGLALGPELAGELKSMIGYGNMNAVLAGICATTAVLSFLYIGGTPRTLQRSKG